MKTCSKCKEEKPFDAFSKSSGGKHGLYNWCKSCASAYAKTRPKPSRAGAVSRRHNLMSYYGITPEKFDELLDGQGGTCATCPATPENTTRNFSVDHNHACCPGVRSCGECVRGILCTKCNSALGMVSDNVQTLENLKKYLLR